MSRTALAALALLLQVSASAAVKNPGTCVHLLQSMSDTLDPFAGNQDIVGNVYETLFGFEGKGSSPTPLLAAAVPSRRDGSVSQDGLTVRIALRKGVRFHDGSPVTAEDVRYCLLREALVERPEGGGSVLVRRLLLGVSTTLGADGKSDLALLRRGYSAVRAERGRVVLTLARPDASLAAILAVRPLIVPRRWAAARGDWDGRLESLLAFSARKAAEAARYEGDDGTGPFAVDYFDRTARELMLKRFDGYWRGPARLERVQLKAVPDFAVRKLMLQSGDADSIVAYRIHETQLAGMPGVQVIDGLKPADGIQPVAFFYMAVSTAANPFIGSGRLDGDGIPPDFFSDRDARLGFIAAFDYDAFRRDVLRGKAAPAAGVIPSGMLGHYDGRGPFVEDRAAARARLRKAWGGRLWEKGFRFSVVYNTGNDLRRDFGMVLKRSVESLNPRFHVEVVGQEWPAFVAALNARKLPIEVSGIYSSYPDPHSYVFNVLHSGGYCARRQGYSDPRVDRLIDRAQAEARPARRAALYRQIQELSFADPTYLIPAEPSGLRVQRSWVRGWVYDPFWPNAPYSGSFYRLWKAP